VSQAVLIAVAVDSEGRRQVLGGRAGQPREPVELARFPVGLKQRGLFGIEFVVSDDHEGLKGAIPRCCEELLQGYNSPQDLLGEEGLFRELKKRLLERALGAALSKHLGYEKGDPAGRGSGNNRNGYWSKTVIGDGRLRSRCRAPPALNPRIKPTAAVACRRRRACRLAGCVCGVARCFARGVARGRRRRGPASDRRSRPRRPCCRRAAARLRTGLTMRRHTTGPRRPIPPLTKEILEPHRLVPWIHLQNLTYTTRNHPAMAGEIIRNPERDQIGLAGEIIPERRATSPRISTEMMHRTGLRFCGRAAAPA
jgi:Transposase, Mutator family